jgi:hypothetical protein
MEFPKQIAIEFSGSRNHLLQLLMTNGVDVRLFRRRRSQRHLHLGVMLNEAFKSCPFDQHGRLTDSQNGHCERLKVLQLNSCHARENALRVLTIKQIQQQQTPARVTLIRLRIPIAITIQKAERQAELIDSDPRAAMIAVHRGDKPNAVALS